MDAAQEKLILDLLQRYKEKFLNVSLAGPYKEGEKANELYKWQLITDCEGKSTIEIIKHFITTKPNVIYRQGDIPVFNYLITNDELGLEKAFNLLTEEKVELSERLNRFKKAMSDLCDDKYNLKANDERTASAFLACWNPKKYTFYKNEIYKNYCNYIGEQPYETGEKYPHYLQLIAELAEMIKQDPELNDKFQNETNGLIQSDLLTAQNILWQMKDNMNWENNLMIQGLVVRDSTDWKESFLEDMKQYGVIWKHQLSDMRDVLPQLRSLILRNRRFPFYNIAKNTTDYVFSVVDFATEDDYDSKKKEWKTKDPCWYCDSFSDYSDGNKVAKIAFLIDNAERIHHESSINIDDFVTYNNKQASRQNAVAYKYIITKADKKQMEQINHYTDILRIKKNIILQGAPGTGKTYNTATLALSICGETIPEKHEDVMKRYDELQKEGRIGFCTFHQSMDYEDFVEGIKPKTENEQIIYKIEPGIFKTISKIATNPILAKRTKSLDAAFDDLVQDILDGNIKTIKLKNGVESKELSVSPQMTIKWKTGDDRIDVNYVSKERLLKLCEVYDSKEKFESMKNIDTSIRSVIGGCNSSYYWAVANYLMNKIVEEQDDAESMKNYVLIIDEINRGNVSKIFGELITLLEADKRIDKNNPDQHTIWVTLPYSKESFAVPSNLYIIGTMNTTDRSVGNIDYAVRRRFAFVTLESKEEVIEEYYKDDEDLKNKALKLFKAIKSFLEKLKFEMDVEDLMVGHSYFMAKDEEELDLKWKYEIIPLLREYYKDGIINQDVKADITIEDFCTSK